MRCFIAIKINQIYLLFFILGVGEATAQMMPESVRISTTSIGTSAISVNTITAKTLSFDYPIYDCHYDSLTNLLFISAKQKNEQLNQFIGKSFFAAINGSTDSVKWLNESLLFDLDLAGQFLLVSKEDKTLRYNKTLGFDELRFDSKVFFSLPKFQTGFMYKAGDSLLKAVNLRTGIISWTAIVPRDEDWIDHKFISDSVLLIAANGLHALHVKKGLIWSKPLATSVATQKALVYSLAKYTSIQKVSNVVYTSEDENRVTQLASNILLDKQKIFFACKDKVVCLDENGNSIWEIDLRSYPISKMYISKTELSLILVNFGLATHSSNFVNWGKPFILTIDPVTGKIQNQYDLSKIENLADFMSTKSSLIFAGKDEILNAIPGETELKSILSLNENKYGKFTEFINGDQYYTFKEGYYVPLNFINDNLIYFKTDNNKIYGIDGDYIEYEYHFTELFKLQQKFDDKTILGNAEKTIITSNNFELLHTFDINDRTLVSKDKIYFIGERRISAVNKNDLK